MGMLFLTTVLGGTFELDFLLPVIAFWPFLAVVIMPALLGGMLAAALAAGGRERTLGASEVIATLVLSYCAIVGFLTLLWAALA